MISSEPQINAVFPHDYDCNDEAKKRRAAVPDVDGDYEGPATIETYTVFYKRDGTVRVGTVIARTPDDKRVLASVPATDAAMIAYLTDGNVEPVGSTGRISKGNNGLMIWSTA